ncbi:hypothetical protein BD289DRAFT_453987 [Coniella lustricola]|uniref:Uncharacterized protein n=1 Tax=Coniella lustricola TaxID=2025994 RepID=A0A2T3A5B8_9PEZI|nr:hypothetical protein BD289DRAFT_453987 [Coniella lustricola]
MPGSETTNPAGDGTKGEGQPKLTDAQTRLLAVMLQNVVGPQPQFDWDAIVAATSYKNVSTVRTIYTQIRKKLGATNSTPTKASGSGVGAGADSATSAGTPLSGPATPTKVTKRVGKVGSVAKSASKTVSASGAGSEFSPINKSKGKGAGRGGKKKSTALVKEEIDSELEAEFDADHDGSGIAGPMDISSPVGVGLGIQNPTSTGKKGAGKGMGNKGAAVKSEPSELKGALKNHSSAKHESIGGGHGVAAEGACRVVKFEENYDDDDEDEERVKAESSATNALKSEEHISPVKQEPSSSEKSVEE